MSGRARATVWRALGEEEDLPPRPDPDTAVPPPSRPLVGVRVVDFGIGGVGVEGGRLLAELGADVVKIETRTYPDFIRIIAGGEMNASFASSSRTKRSFGVNLKTSEGLALCHRLMSAADVVIENLSAGAMDAMQVGYGSARALNPRLVMVSSQLLGSSGPWSNWTGYGPSTQPVAGLLSVWDYDDDDPPAGNTTILPDHLAGRVVAIGALAGLIGRHRSGAGCHVEVAQAEVDHGRDRRPAPEGGLPSRFGPGRRGTVGTTGTPWGAYPCAGEQQWCVITVRDDSDWKQLQAALDASGLGREGRLRICRRPAGGPRRAGPQPDRMDPRPDQVGGGQPAAGLRRPLRSRADRGRPAPRSPSPGPRLPGSASSSRMLGPLTFEGPCYLASGMPGPLITQAPRLGEHTREICARGPRPDRRRVRSPGRPGGAGSLAAASRG